MDHNWDLGRHWIDSCQFYLRFPDLETRQKFDETISINPIGS